jgi:hypothetical protein
MTTMKRAPVGMCGGALLALFMTAMVPAQSVSGQQDDEGAAARGPLSPALVGSWKAEPEKTPLASEFDVSVWGPGASAVRDVALTVSPSGEGTLTVTRKVVDGRGRVKPASTSVEEVRLTLQGPQESTGPRIEHGVKVARAERRFPDDPKDISPIDGLRVRVVSFADNDRTIEIRFDTAEGRGSFWQTLTREKGGPRPAPKAQAPPK